MRLSKGIMLAIFKCHAPVMVVTTPLPLSVNACCRATKAIYKQKKQENGKKQQRGMKDCSAFLQNLLQW